MCSLLGAGCTMDPSTFCWIARRILPEKEPNADEKEPNADGTAGGPVGGVAGANFGMPHRDFTYLQSYVQPQKNEVKGKEEEGKDGVNGKEEEAKEQEKGGATGDAVRPPPALLRRAVTISRQIVRH